METRKLIGFLLMVLCLFICSIYSYTKGFLLSRTVISSNSTCRRPNDLPFEKVSYSCWMPKRFKKAIIIVIDGLRYDFVSHDDDYEMNSYAFKKLTVMQELLSKGNKNAALYKTIADAPTTTMQRLKAITTGGYPTFIDAGANFASFEINEDNIIDQFLTAGKKVVFMGDDTWDVLFPKRFHRSFMYPSFNVKDLDTVDNGISEKLLPEMNRTDWDVLIAHGLGIDHCGHTYGAKHPVMGGKLEQYDNIIRSVIKEMDKETVLFVLGDHGMTYSGDHGGDSKDEVETALFVYSHEPFLSSKFKMPKTINQVDLVPTISLLLGIPIPFGNTGKVITDLLTSKHDVLKNKFPSSLKESVYSSAAVYLNVLQVHNFITSYQNTSHSFSPNDMDTLESMFMEILTEARSIFLKNVKLTRLESFQELCLTYLLQSSNICQKNWAQFNVLLMFSGLAILFLTLVTLLLFLVSGIQNFQASISFILYIPVIAILINALSPSIIATNVCCFLAVLCCLGVLLLMLIKLVRGFQATIRKIVENLSLSDWVAIICIGIQLLSFLSNSYLVSEDDVTTFLLQTLLWSETLVANWLKNSPESNSKTKKTKNDTSNRDWFYITKIGSLIVASHFVKILAVYFRKCREEQNWCSQSINFIQPLYAISQDQTSLRNYRFLFSVVLVIVLLLIFYTWQRHTGNLNGYSFPVVCSSYLPLIMVVCLCASWVFQSVPSEMLKKLNLSNIGFLPNINFFVAFFLLCLLFSYPLFIFVKPKESGDDIVPLFSSSGKEVVHSVYHHIRLNWKKHFTSAVKSKEPEPVVVYGLATNFSSSLLLLFYTIVLTAATIHSDGLIPAFVIITLVAFCNLLITSSNKIERMCNLKEDAFMVPCSCVVLWHMIMSHAFFSTAHQLTFPAIHWYAAFVGSSGDFQNYFVPASKVLLNTFSAQVIFGTCLPLIIIWPITQYIMFPKIMSQSPNLRKIEEKGELIFLDEADRFKTSLLNLIVGFLLIQGSRLFFSMTAAAILRRHLMVWKIFAPKFIFEALGTIFVTVSCIFGAGLVLRIMKVVDIFMKKIQKTGDGEIAE